MRKILLAFLFVMLITQACPANTHQREILLTQKIQKINPALTTNEAIEIVVCVEFYAAKHNLPAHLLYGVIHVESHFKAQAKSSRHARGLMQVTPIWRNKIPEYTAQASLSKPHRNIAVGSRILHEYVLLASKHRAKDPIRTALAYYNAGPTGARAGGGWRYADKVLKVSRIYTY